MSRRLLVFALVAAVAAPQAAQAASVLDTRVTASGSAAAPCQQALRRGAPGVVTRPVLAPSAGLLTVRLDGQGDWDVAVFDAAGRAIAADASPDAQEVAVGYAYAAGTLRVQACRRSGDAASVPATLEHAALRDGALELAKRNAPKLVSVITPTRAQKDQLLALGLDMTEHGGSESLGVVLHGPDDEAALRKAGLRWLVLVDDLVAQSHRQRAAESRRAAVAAASALPSGRTTYRTLADYNTELKELADANPGLVRLFTLPNKTWLGKDVMGIEITTDVHAERWQAGVPEHGRPPCARVALGRARDGVGLRADQRLQGR